VLEAGVLPVDDVLFPVELGMEGGGGMYVMGGWLETEMLWVTDELGISFVIVHGQSVMVRVVADVIV